MRFLLLPLLLFVACNSSDQVTAETVEAPIVVPASSAPAYIQKIEVAHKRTAFYEQEAVKFNLQLFFGGNERLNGAITLLTNSRAGRLQMNDGTTIYFKDGKVYYPADMQNADRVRFTALTWPYFFMLPYKMGDAGTKWAQWPQDSLNNKLYNVQQLTFEAGTGDAPDDWYIVYSDPQTHKLDFAAYIVTAGKTREEAEKNPHAIQYSNYTEVEGIPIATEWNFWEWREGEGVTKEIGNATLRNIVFLTPAEGTFTPPEDFLSK